jgi:hypothetical protein
MLLYLVAKYKSEASAKLAQLGTEYDPQPPFGGIDWRSGDREVARRLRAAQGHYDRCRQIEDAKR